MKVSARAIRQEQTSGRGVRQGARRRIVLILAGVAIVAMALAGITLAYASEIFTVTNLCDNSTDDQASQISGDRVVWEGWDGSDYEIYTRTPGGAAFQMTDNTTEDRQPQVSGDRVVWEGWDGSDYEIYTWTLGYGDFHQITNNGTNDYSPRVSGDRVVWYAPDGSDYEIYTWTPLGGFYQITDTAAHEYFPLVSGDRVVWAAFDGADEEVYTWTPSGGIVNLSDNTYEDAFPQISGDRVVWRGYDGSDYEIYTWTSGGVVNLSDNETGDEAPQVSGDRVVWSRPDGSDYELCTWTPLGGIAQITDNTSDDSALGVSGDRLVWAGMSDYGRDLYTWTPDDGITCLNVSATPPDIGGAQVSGDRIVWAAWDGSDSEVYLALSGGAMPPAPTVSGVSPDEGSVLGGESVTITGTGFTGATKVTFGGVDGTIDSVDSDAQITATTPANAAGTVDVEVTNVGGTGTQASAYTYIAVPSVTWLDPAYGPTAGGNEISFMGSDIAGATKVTIDGTSVNFEVEDPGYGLLISFTAPAHAAAVVTVAVTTLGGTSVETGNYEYVEAPTVSSVSPGMGPITGGQSVTLVGTDLVGVTSVTFDGYAAGDLAMVGGSGGTQFTCTTPAHDSGLVTVQVNAAGGSSTAVDNYTYVVVPVVSGVSPNAGPISGGQLVTITGSGFDGTEVVLFGGSEATSFTVVNDNEITATAPAHAAGLVTVQVVRGIVGSAQADNYTYIDATPTRYQETDGRLIYTAVWTTSTYWPYSAGNAKYSYQSGATVTIPFRGNRLDWVTKTANTLGIASVSVDGGAAVMVDLYSPRTAYKQKVFSTGYLPDGLHWVKISHTGTRNAKSIGHAITIDAVDVVGQLAWATRYQENDPRVMFGPGWATSWNWSYSGGKLKVCSTPPLSTAYVGPVEVLPGSVVVRFKGACLNLVAVKSLYSGKAWVSVDGGPKVAVDLYSPVKHYKKTVFSTGFLTPGIHTVTISWSGLKNPYSKGTNINADAFDIIGEIGAGVF